MLISSDFVMLQFPRTGSSFVRKVLKEIYAARSDRCFREILVPNIRVNGALERFDHHGTYSQIPRSDAGKLVVSIARDPCSRLLSLFRYRFWVSSSPLPREIATRCFPTFPDLTLIEYVELERMTIPYRLGFELMDGVVIGHQSVQFIQMYCKQPKAVLSKLTNAYIDSDLIRDDIGDVEFLRQEHLRSELKRLMARFGLSPTESAIIDSTPDSNVSGTSDAIVPMLADSDVVARVAESERLMYRCYERAGIIY